MKFIDSRNEYIVPAATLEKKFLPENYASLIACYAVYPAVLKLHLRLLAA